MPTPEASTPKITLKPGKDARIAAGHVWAFRNDVARFEGAVANGEAADLFDAAGRFLGRGLVSVESNITLRLFSREAEPLDDAFFRRGLEAAIELRRRSGLPSAETTACRLVFAEADGLPGLIVDRLGDHLVLSAQTVGIERRKRALAQQLLELVDAQSVYERSDVAIRQREGLAPATGVLAGDGPVDAVVVENGVTFRVDFALGMKTGHFCDQRENRFLIRRFATGARALDVFTYTGGFALNLVVGGAASVLAVDQSQAALDALGRNIELNELDASRFELRRGNAFHVLRDLAATAPQSFDVVVLDPPAFAKSRAGLDGALRGYKEIMIRGLELLRDGGVLLACSCTQHVDRGTFRDVLRQAAADTRRRLRLVAETGHAADHPVVLNVPESEYLKALLVEVSRLP